MPIVESTYRAPFLLRNKHLGTIYPTLFRKVEPQKYIRKRYKTPDNDFFDVDFLRNQNSRLCIIMHGLEGSSKSKYAEGLAGTLSNHKFDVAVLNHRGCSGEANNLLQSYHSGHTKDIDFFIPQIEEDYQEIYLVGFSLGGNILLKYLGEKENLSSKITNSVAVSVPCDLQGSSYELKKRSNKIYMERFLKTLKVKTLEKLNKYDTNITKESIISCKNFFDFDGIFTGPIHGFKDAFDYWSKSSSKQFIPKIKTRTLLINAQNDPFLSESCFPYQEASENQNFFFETPKHGGHVGFRSKRNYWIEERVLEFFNN